MKKTLILLIFLLHLPLLLHAQFQHQCFKIETELTSIVNKVNYFIPNDTTLVTTINEPISHLAISGRAMLENLNDSYVRVILKDNYNYEYLIYENFGLLSDSLSSDFQDIALETQYMPDCIPQSIKIEVHKATLQLTNIKYAQSPTSNLKQQTKISSIRQEQTLFIIAKLNEQLERRKMIWRAGNTPLSEMSYEDKKGVFGDSVPMLYGFEYFAGGIFVLPDEYDNSSRNKSSIDRIANNYVNEWDWRNRHGKNWLTPVKSCQACWDFAAVSLTEAYVNLYYNRLINIDLSEQEIMSCLSKNCTPWYVSSALNYIKSNGVVNEDCFPFVATARDCSDKCDYPAERVLIDNYEFFNPNNGEDGLKQRLFKQPLTFSLKDWSHSMLLSGYKTIQHGDTIYIGNSSPNASGSSNYIIIDSIQHQSMIGRTAWLMKDSWWGRGGFFYVIVDINTSKVANIYGIKGKITSLQYDDSDIVCEDADGDGYYFWGVGEKPSSMPSWIPEIPDGDDSNNIKGALDAFGFLEELNDMPTYTVSGNEIFNTRHFHIGHIRIPSNCTLTISNILNLIGNETIYIENGGCLLIDGGIIANAAINIANGGSLKIINDGKILLRKNCDFVTPTSAEFESYHGDILPYGKY